MPLRIRDEKHPITLVREKARKEAMEATANEEGQDYCRICRGEAFPNQPLYYPCKCSGSIKFVHQECLMEWLSHSQKKYCELCKTPFRFTKLYDRSMPATLPFPLFLRRLVHHGVKGISRWIRYLLVGLIWICCLPWCIRQIWRGLFWLADGSWLDQKDVQVATKAGPNVTATLSAAQHSETLAINFTVPPYLERITLVFPPMQISLADIARIFFSQGLIGKIFQLILSNFLPRSRHGGGPAHTSNTTLDSSYPRRPSLLSEVRFLAQWSSSPPVNHATIDVVEGQLICVLLVTAFILVFLIREWVINQQPVANMPEDDIADAPPPVPQPEGERQRAARPRHRLHRHGVEANPEGEAMALDRGPRPIAVPRLRRAMTDDVTLNGTENQVDRPTLPVPSHSLSNNSDRLREQDVEDVIGESSVIADDVKSRPVRRHSLSNSILVQREVEVAPSIDPADPNDYERCPDYFQNVSTSALDSRQFHPLEPQELDQSASGPSDSSRARAPFAAAAESPREEDQDRVDQDGSADETDSDGPAIPTPNSSDVDHASQPSQPSLTDGDHESSEQAPVRADQAPVEEPSLWGKISAWLWYTEDQSNDQPGTAMQNDAGAEGQDDEHVVEDVFAEAPFVPNHNRERQPVLEAPPADVREPNNAPFGIDLNDPNALEDAEDLDGVLELLGMEGPIFGMVQNVIFSLFLITVTLSASIWCPYIWGKIALLFMSNPTGMLVKVPLYVLSKTADIVVDILFFVAGLAGFFLNQPVKIIKAITSPLFPAFSNVLDTALIEGLTLDLSQKSGARLERTLSGAVLNMKPDVPTFSILSHHALNSFKGSLNETLQGTVSIVLYARDSLAAEPVTSRTILLGLGEMLKAVSQLPKMISQLVELVLDIVHRVAKDLTPASPNGDGMDLSLVEWSTEDRILTIVLGYAFLAIAGIVFLEVARLILGLKDNEKVEGYFADCLRQAGGVMKVIVIIGIEMLVFPLYCGLLLDVALLPLFANATLAGRISFMIQTPFTGIFLHWFIGTCYMFHFALFVSICRKIMRTGVLYFIRDPDDPTFHPVRDVLERSVPAQLGKIAFSALVYGGLVIVCLGGVVWSLQWFGGILPIQWATSEPRLAFPVDIIFYNFMLPLVLRQAEPSKKISAMYEWWFRGCARALRLTDFLFGERRTDETYSRLRRYGWIPRDGTDILYDGKYVRAPASDSVRIAKGQNVFLEVNEQNERVDGQPDSDYGIHGKKNHRFTKVYLPPRFRTRIATFVFLLWVFAASTGVACTIGPLVVGRKVTRFLSQSNLPPNDLYAFTVGIHVFAALGYAIAYARPAQIYLKTKIPQWFGTQLIASIKYVLGLAYLGIFTTVILPFVLAMITELYIHIPLYTYLELGQEKSKSPNSPRSDYPVATIFILQSWTIGLLYLRLLLRLFMHHVAPDSQVATALRAITRDGYLKPDVRLASRAFVLPATVICTVLLVTPLAYAKMIIVLLRIHDPEMKMRLYRMAYPGILGLFMTWGAIILMQQQLASWRVKIRDEVYLIGERLHNFHEPGPEKSARRKGKETAL
ncbi:uncharacterized protein Z518_07260 [Rhinocladiella mackenziei CBS 650.93]|uniref:RING-type E3 ubiquitin transferase n=1 Tax=Rhinocladiella mackenziei CBS 650.93 TaxID=1442369 RepID=A0A0D2FNQ2_9EURO|nr:uncharacterized protein Z518_07260 [Rhinocladiella mackenziei CBS 650.93]KIX03707.1 hypothetical protein Z518_07260 [Rhinocladiella mackenziei CBS 650.93]